jgi:hypothetical protein
VRLQKRKTYEILIFQILPRNNDDGAVCGVGARPDRRARAARSRVSRRDAARARVCPGKGSGPTRCAAECSTRAAPSAGPLSHNATRFGAIAAKCVRSGFAHAPSGFRATKPAPRGPIGPGPLGPRAAPKAGESRAQMHFFYDKPNPNRPRKRGPKMSIWPAESARYACRGESHCMMFCIKMFLSFDVSPKDERNTRRVTPAGPTPDRLSRSIARN